MTLQHVSRSWGIWQKFKTFAVAWILSLLVLSLFIMNSILLVPLSTGYYETYSKDSGITTSSLDRLVMHRMVPVNRNIITRADEMLALRQLPKECLLNDTCRVSEFDLFLQDPNAMIPAAPLYSENFFRKLKLLSQRCQSDKRVAVCMVTRGSADMIADFIIHHILLGISHFYIYDNDSPDETPEILQHFAEHGWVTYQSKPGSDVQKSTQTECMYLTYKKNYTWAFFPDTDERILPYEDFCVPNFLKRYENLSPSSKKVESVRVNWFFAAPSRRVFGGAKFDPKWSALDDMLRFNTIIGDVHHDVKSFVYLPSVPLLKPEFPHYVISKNSSFCSMTTTFECESWPRKLMVYDDLAVIGHAHYRSYYEYIKKIDYGRPTLANSPSIDRSNMNLSRSISSILERFESNAVDSYKEALSKRYLGLHDTFKNAKLKLFLEELKGVRDNLYEGEFE